MCNCLIHRYVRKLFVLPDFSGTLACVQDPDDPKGLELLEGGERGSRGEAL